LLTLFANLNMQQKEKLNELISAIHEKDELLDSQEDFLIKENKKHVKVKNAYALEVEKCEKISSELSTCHDVISNLRNENAKLIAKVEKSNVCDDSIDNIRNDHASSIAKIEKLNVSLTSLRNENEKLIAKAVGAKAKTLPFARCLRQSRGTDGGETTGSLHPSSNTPQDEGLRRGRPIPQPRPTRRPTGNSAHCNRPRVVAAHYGPNL
jgi:uncharacterized protein YdcH (DUF465 family)